MSRLKRIGFVAIAIAGIVVLHAEESRQYFFTHILFAPLRNSLSPGERIPEDGQQVLSGRPKDIPVRTMGLRKIPGRNNEIEITFPAVKGVRFLATTKDGLIEKLVRFRNGEEDTFLRIDDPVHAPGADPGHADFSRNIFRALFRTEEINLNFDGERREIQIKLLGLRAFDETVILQFQLETEPFSRVVQYRGERLVSTEHLTRRDTSPWLHLVVHFARFRDTWYPGDSYVLYGGKLGELTDYYHNGLIKSYTTAIDDHWSNQKVWLPDGRFEAAYPYPPGKPRVKITKFDFNWIQDLDKLNYLSTEERAYWDEPTQSPRYSLLLKRDNRKKVDTIVFYFSANNELLERKFAELRQSLPSPVPNDDGSFFFRGEEEFPCGLCLLRPGMILQVSSKQNAAAEALAQEICQLWKIHQQKGKPSK